METIERERWQYAIQVANSELSSIADKSEPTDDDLVNAELCRIAINRAETALKPREGSADDGIFGFERATFQERLAALAGRTTFCTPGGGGTKHDTVPYEHKLATALGLARRKVKYGAEWVNDWSDVGPALALGIATQRRAEKPEVTIAVCAEIHKAIHAPKGIVSRAVNYAYESLVMGIPQEIDEWLCDDADAYQILRDVAYRAMVRMVEETLVTAERIYRGNE